MGIIRRMMGPRMEYRVPLEVTYALAMGAAGIVTRSGIFVRVQVSHSYRNVGVIVAPKNRWRGRSG